MDKNQGATTYNDACCRCRKEIVVFAGEEHSGMIEHRYTFEVCKAVVIIIRCTCGRLLKYGFVTVDPCPDCGYTGFKYVGRESLEDNTWRMVCGNCNKTTSIGVPVAKN